MDTPVSIERTYNAPVEKIWKALTDKEQMKQWYFNISDFKPEAGFEFQFTGEGKTGEKFLHLCLITEAVENRMLRHSWRYKGYDGNSFVTWELFDEGDKTRIKLTHEGVASFPKTPTDDFAKANFEEGWAYITGVSLKEFVENK